MSFHFSKYLNSIYLNNVPCLCSENQGPAIENYFHYPSNIQRLHCACAVQITYCRQFVLLVRDCSDHRKNANYFSHTRTHWTKQAAVRTLFATTVGDYIHYWPVCLYTLCSTPARCHHRCRCRCRRRRCRRCMLVGWLPGCLTLRYRYFCCPPACLPAFACLLLASTAVLCSLWLCVLFDGLAVHSFVRFASVCLAVCMFCLCFSSACLYLCHCLCLVFRFALPRFALLCSAVLCAVVPLLGTAASVEFQFSFLYSLAVHFVQRCSVPVVPASVQSKFLDRAGPRVK